MPQDEASAAFIESAEGATNFMMVLLAIALVFQVAGSGANSEYLTLLIRSL